MGDDVPVGSVYVTPRQMWESIQETQRIANATATEVRELTAVIRPAMNDVRAGEERNRDALIINDKRILRLEDARPTKHGWPVVWSSIAVIVSTLTVILEFVMHH